MIKIKKSGHKTQAQAIMEYKAFMLMALGGAENFVTHPEMQGHLVPNTSENKRVIALMPTPHVRITYGSTNSDDSSLTSIIRLTPAAHDLFKDISPDMLAKLTELREASPNAFRLPDDTGNISQAFAMELNRIAQLEKELAEEDRSN